MNKIYYTINEDQARIAHEMMSMRDYKTNERTNEYKTQVDQAWKIVEEIRKKNPRKIEAAEKKADLYSRKLAEYINNDSRIGTMCPSILISGAGNFPTEKKEKQISAWNSNDKLYSYCKDLMYELKNLIRDTSVRSGDADAVQALKDKIEKREKEHQFMKDVNKALRLKDEVKKEEKLFELFAGNKKAIEEIKKPDFIGRIGYASYTLQNNNAEIRRLKKRLEELEKAKNEDEEEKEIEYNNFTVVKNIDIMRLQILFDDIPDKEVREILKKHAFRWSPKNKAWQRQYTKNGEYALKKVIEEIEDLEEDINGN